MTSGGPGIDGGEAASKAGKALFATAGAVSEPAVGPASPAGAACKAREPVSTDAEPLSRRAVAVFIAAAGRLTGAGDRPKPVVGLSARIVRSFTRGNGGSTGGAGGSTGVDGGSTRGDGESKP